MTTLADRKIELEVSYEDYQKIPDEDQSLYGLSREDLIKCHVSNVPGVMEVEVTETDNSSARAVHITVQLSFLDKKDMVATFAECAIKSCVAEPEPLNKPLFIFI